MFLIPSIELEKRNIFKSDISNGIKTFYVYTLDYKKNQWTQEYCIDTEAEDSEKNLRILLEKCKTKCIQKEYKNHIL